MSLKVCKPTQGRKYLIFSSTGEYARVNNWLGKNRNYDIWLTHYSSDSSPFESEVEFLNYRKGGKFQNLQFAVKNWPELFEQYEYIWVTDDDIGMDKKRINKFFRTSEKYSLTASQPAFDRLGKISYDITIERPKYILRYTNFVENTCPLVRKDALFFFMENYDERLTGYGGDWLLSHYLYKLEDPKIAIIDSIRCHNPHDRVKGGQREIDKLQPHEQRRAIFQQVKKDHGVTIDEQGPIEFGRIENTNKLEVAAKQVRQILFDKLKRRARWLLEDLKIIPKVRS